jgi:hypothetical protein
MSKQSKVSVIKQYFGMHDGDTAKDFMVELKALSGDERLELAQGAAKELGLATEQVDFELTA